MSNKKILHFLNKLKRIYINCFLLFYHPKCRLCDGNTIKVSAYHRTFFKCGQCDFVFAVDYFSYLKQKGMGMEGSWSGPAGGGYREFYLVEFLREHLKKERFLLYGTGNTPTLSSLLDKGVDVIGCDISPNVIQHKRETLGEERFYSPENLPENKKFDAIVAVEVIEHFSDPFKAFKLLLDRLNPGGVICGTTDFYLGKEIEDKNTPGYMSLESHLAYWSPKSLGTLLNKFGFKLSFFKLVCPGSILPDEKYGQLFPNKRVFFIYDPDYYDIFFKSLAVSTPVLPIDKP